MKSVVCCTTYISHLSKDLSRFECKTKDKFNWRLVYTGRYDYNDWFNISLCYE